MIYWPLVRRATYNLLVQQLQQAKLELNVSESSLEHEKGRGDDKRDRLIAARQIIDKQKEEIEALKEERDNWRKEASK